MATVKSLQRNFMRLNKFISYNSYYSRREAEAIIKEGEVKVDNQMQTNPGFEVASSKSRVFVKGQYIKPKANYTCIAYHKGKGELVTKKDDRGRKTIFHALSSQFRGFTPVGRLDFASEGLLLLTDAPDIATRLMTSDLEFEYRVKIKGVIKDEVFEAMETGFENVHIKRGVHEYSHIYTMSFVTFSSYAVLKNQADFSILKLRVTEGKNRDLRRFFGYFGLEVVDLRRVRYGFMELNQLKSGKWRYFTPQEYSKLRAFLEKNSNSKNRQPKVWSPINHAKSCRS